MPRWVTAVGIQRMRRCIYIVLPVQWSCVIYGRLNGRSTELVDTSSQRVYIHTHRFRIRILLQIWIKLNWRFLTTILKCHQILNIKFAEMSYSWLVNLQRESSIVLYCPENNCWNKRVFSRWGKGWDRWWWPDMDRQCGMTLQCQLKPVFVFVSWYQLLSS